MKKSTKSTKPASPASPQVKPESKTVEPKAAKKPAAPRKKSTVPASPSTAVPPAVVEEKVPTAIVSPIDAVTIVAATETTITAQIDVGFGNALYIRGEGAGLSWEKGRPLDCVAVDKWSITVVDTNKPVIFKFLLNDETWSAGSDYVIEPGRSIVLEPVF